MSNFRVALVTGSTSGIGVAIAQTLASAGFQVLVTGRSEERGAQVASDIGGGAHFIRCDLLETGAPKWLVDQTLAHYGRLDVLVNNAAVDHTDNLLDVTA